MAGRLEPIVYNWIKGVTWGIVITIKRKANGLFIFSAYKWAVLGDSFACAHAVNFMEY